MKKKSAKKSRRRTNWRHKLLSIGQALFLGSFLLSLAFLGFSYSGSSKDMTAKLKNFSNEQKIYQQSKQILSGLKTKYETVIEETIEKKSN